jgi:anti-sigma regulatory factor (Ser/Thr protein kinase)
MATFPCQTASAGAARRFVRSVCEGLVDEDVVEVAILLTSELVANSVIHGRSAVTVVVSTPDEDLRVAVTDDSDQWPTLDAVGPFREGGRGMALVDAISTAWGVAPRGTGKTVWFTLSRRPPTP